MHTLPRRIPRELLAALEGHLDHHFGRVALLEHALTHSSYANEFGLGQEHNERQEFLGDAVLELCVSWELFRRFPQAREGDLTRLRSSLVSTASFARMARRTGIDKLLRLGRGEEAQGGRSRDTVLSDAFEAVMAAVYEDGGFDAACRSVAAVFAGLWPGTADACMKERDPKTKLQELVQHLFAGERPVYTQVGESGPGHARTFTVSVALPDGRRFVAGNTSCKKAEQCAAAIALEALEKGQGQGGAQDVAPSQAKAPAQGRVQAQEKDPAQEAAPAPAKD